MENVKELSSTVEIVKTLPQGTDKTDQTIKLSYLEGWDELSEDQKSYVSVYFDMYPQTIKSLMASGIKQSEFDEWKNNDKVFMKVIDTVEKIHSENLAAVNYVESYTNSNIRSKQLKAMKQEGFTKEGGDRASNNINFYGLSMDEANKLLKSKD